ncbi:hypothetical protein BsWGS_29027 [Bradybaena similaris]
MARWFNLRERLAGPTLDDVTHARCPEDRPYKCLPYGVCYNVESYCSSISRTIEPCFPSRLLDNDAGLMSWCKQFVQGEVLNLPHHSCLFACYHRFNATQLFDLNHNSLMFTRLQTEAVVLISVLINWIVCGAILLVLITYCKAYRSTSATTRKSIFCKLLTKRKGHVTRIHLRRAEEASYTEPGEELELQPISSCNSSRTDKLASLQIHTTKDNPEKATEKLCVVLDEHDINKKAVPSLNLQSRQREDERDLTFQTIPSYPGARSPYGDSSDERSLLDDVDLSNVASLSHVVQGQNVWHE